MKDRLHQWWKRFLVKAKEKWLLWILFIPFAILEDRFTGFINRKIDEHGAQIMPWIKTSFMWAQDSPLGIVGLIFVTVILGLLIHAYVETRPTLSAAAGDKVGIPTIIQHQPTAEQKAITEKAKEPARQPGHTAPISNMSGSGILIEAKQSDYNLYFLLTNKISPTPLKDCEVCINDFRIWSRAIGQFSIIGAFDSKDDLLPMRIYGPANLYADDPAVCNFIESNDKEQLRIASLEPVRTVILPKKAGIWCVYLLVRVGGKSFSHRACFEWLPRETLNFVQCPDFSLAEIQIP